MYTPHGFTSIETGNGATKEGGWRAQTDGKMGLFYKLRPLIEAGEKLR